MAKLIFVNLPVADLAKSTAFYEAAGAFRNPHFSDETAACMVFSDTIHVMILTHAKFSSFTARAIPDATKTAQVMLCLSAESRDAVDAQVDTAAAVGGQADPNPQQDYGFMYSRSVADPDGHIWEIMFMDLAAAEHHAPETQPA